MNPNDPYGQLPPSPQPMPPQPTAAANQPYYSQPPVQPSETTQTPSNPYDFILNPTAKQKNSLPSSTKKLVMIVSIISVIVIVGGLLITSLAPTSSSKANLVSLAQQQQEIIRVSQGGERLGSDQTTKNLAYSIDLSVSTNQHQLIAYMDAKGSKVSTKQLTVTADPATDSLLKAAQATSTYDSAFNKVIADELTTYMSTLQDTYKTTSNVRLKQILSDSYAAAKTLLSQAQEP